MRVSGPRVELLNQTLKNDASKLAVGEAQYTLMCNEQDGTIDDLYAYRIGDQEFLLVINASRIADVKQRCEIFCFALDDLAHAC